MVSCGRYRSHGRWFNLARKEQRMTTLFRKLFLAGLFGSAVLMPRFMEPVAAEAATAGNCAPTAIKYKVADRTSSTTSQNFALLTEAYVVIIQAGPGSSCVVVSFTADARTEFAGTLADVAIYVDSKFCRGGTLVSPQIDYFTTTINAVCPDVRPGSRRIEVRFRSSGVAGNVDLTNYTTIVHYTK
jgi:hypothetical protein